MPVAQPAQAVLNADLGDGIELHMVEGRAVIVADGFVEKAIAQQIQNTVGHQPPAVGVGGAIGNDLLVHQLHRDGQMNNAENALGQVMRKNQAQHQYRCHAPNRPASAGSH